MRKHVVAALSCLVVCVASVAQDSTRTPRFEVFGGYSLLHSNLGAPGSNTNGWNASVNTNVLPWLGAVADFSGNYFRQTYTWPMPFSANPTDTQTFRLSMNLHRFLFGPQVSYRHRRGVLFAHSLFGTAYGAYNIKVLQAPANAVVLGSSTTDNRLAVAFGGGVDLTVGHGLAVRPVQVDYLYFHNNGIAKNAFRYSAGIVFRLGAR